MFNSFIKSAQRKLSVAGANNPPAPSTKVISFSFEKDLKSSFILFISILTPDNLAAKAGDTSPFKRYEHFVFIFCESSFIASKSGANNPLSDSMAPDC